MARLPGRHGEPHAVRFVDHESDLAGIRRRSTGTRRAPSLHEHGPPGVGDGSRVRVAGEGERGASGGASGDLYLRIQLAPHTTFERKGRDLYTRVQLPLTVAVLGGEVDVPALGGRTLRLKVPAGTQNGQVFRLRSQGMALTGRPGEKSDLYATVDVLLPRQLTPEQRSH